MTVPTDPTALAVHLRGLSDELLRACEAELVASFDALYVGGLENVSLESAEAISTQILAARAELQVRAATAATAGSAEALREQIHAQSEDAPEEEPEEDSEVAPEPEIDEEPNEESSQPEADPESTQEEAVVPDTPETAVTAPDVEAIAASVARAIGQELVAALRPTVPVEDVLVAGGSSLNRHLSGLGRAASFAPDPQVGSQDRETSVMTASADIPGFVQGSAINDIETMVEAVHARARSLGVTKAGEGAIGSNLVAVMNRKFRHHLDLNSTPQQVDEVLRQAADVEEMVAAGGWCAPSEIRYDFFNIICEDGMLDLPSVGVLNRGGFRFPTSASLADVVAASPDGLWTWTETDDQAAATGSPTKDCVRVPCPAFNDVRLVCEGLCLTAGNLIDFAYPENVANYLRLLMATRAHLTNSRIIGLLQADSTAITMGTPTGGFYGDLMNALDFQAQDLRAKYAACSDSMIEAVLPEWALGALRSDWARRTGIDDPARSLSQLMADLDMRNVRAQFVQDYQVRTAGKPGASTAPTQWPTTVEMLVYSPGTWVRGQGLQLNLGVVRDSVLNTTNDHTAAWMEDCYAVAKVGHESRKVTVNVCVAGTTGAANIAC